MAHPTYALLVETFKYEAVVVISCLASAVFALVGVLYLAAKRMSNYLTSVAYAEHRYAEVEYRLVDTRCAVCIYAVGTARKDDAYRRQLFYLLNGDGMRIHLAIDVVLSYASCDKLIVLTAKVNYQHLFVVHKQKLLFCMYLII